MSQITDAMPFASLLDIELLEASPRKITGKMTVKPDFCTIGGTIHGGALMAFADSLAAAGAFLCLADGAKGTTTIESKTNFIGRAAEGSRVFAISTPISAGKRISVWQTRITDENQKVIAFTTQSQLVIR